jgi:hypothetical protein
MPRAARSFHLEPVARELTDEALAGIVDAALRRAALVRAMRDALQTGDDQHALELARELVGLEKQVKRK